MDPEPVEIGAVSKKVQAKVNDFAQKHNLDEKTRSRLAGSDDVAVTRVLEKELPRRVRNPNAYVTRMLRTSEREVASEREAGHYDGDEAAETGWRQAAWTEEAWRAMGGEGCDDTHGATWQEGGFSDDTAGCR